MQLHSTTFEQAGNWAKPSSITVTMSLKEAIWIAKVAGEQTDEPEAQEGREIYDCLIDNVFNRYWEDGIKDAFREYPVSI